MGRLPLIVHVREMHSVGVCNKKRIKGTNEHKVAGGSYQTA